MILIVFSMLVLSVLLESKILGKNYYFPSPVFVLSSCIIFVYLLPILGSSYYFAIVPSLINGLDFSELKKLEFFILAFSVSFFLFYFLISAVVFKGARNWSVSVINGTVTYKNVLILFILALIVKYIYLATGLSFSPAAVFDRFMSPRDYTYIKKGTGFINYIHSVFLHALLFVSCYFFLKRKDLNYIIRFCIILLPLILVFFGGGKQNYLWIIVYWSVISFKLFSFKLSNFNVIKKIFGFGCLFLALLWFSFSFVVTSDSGSKVGFLSKLADYQREPYFSARVINDFNWNLEYTAVGISDTMIAIVPRSLWSDKPLVGFYRRYWQPRYESSVVEYHTTTYGFISESYMFFGYLGPVVYALIWALMCSYMAKINIKTNEISSLFRCSFLLLLFYFFVRDGFSGFTFWYSIIVLFLSGLLVKYKFKW
ncbi:putative O-antigen polymerase [Photobacterium marinum]|uniref:Putative O-antigen polymerase n=1 Tax=Photobacterium marinum TaxID=1056511 RepID=L8J4W9_9GAMM|nr:O-antigen polymerase [Photobacterium marinum]ELR63771.1 putative O-antigen polymerase [Photobacterium marinum]